VQHIFSPHYHTTACINSPWEQRDFRVGKRSSGPPVRRRFVGLLRRRGYAALLCNCLASFLCVFPYSSASQFLPLPFKAGSRQLPASYLLLRFPRVSSDGAALHQRRRLKRAGMYYYCRERGRLYCTIGILYVCEVKTTRGFGPHFGGWYDDMYDATLRYTLYHREKSSDATWCLRTLGIICWRTWNQELVYRWECT